MNKENQYRQEESAIDETLKQDEYHFFLTLRDKRPSDEYRAFRRTDEWGYYNRDKIAARVMGAFRKSYGIRSPRRSKPKFYDAVIHEAGVGRSHILTRDAGHLHLAIGFRKESRFYREPLKHFAEVLKALKRQLPWLDCCFSIGNCGKQILIEDQASVAAYMAKHEKGAIDGEPFMKRPFFWNAPSLDVLTE